MGNRNRNSSLEKGLEKRLSRGEVRQKATRNTSAVFDKRDLACKKALGLVQRNLKMLQLLDVKGKGRSRERVHRPLIGSEPAFANFAIREEIN